MSKKMSFSDQKSISNVNKPLKVLFCLLSAWLLTRCLSMEKIQEMLESWKKRKNVSSITFSEATVVHQSMQRMKSWVWLRLACLETALALVIYVYLEKKSIDFCIGVKLYPFESHAWVEVKGVPVQEPEEITRYKKLLVI